MFRILGLLLIVVGGMAMFAGLLGAGGEGNSLTSFISGIACLFWAALMYAIAEVLTRLAEISAAVRKQAEWIDTQP